MFPKGAVWQEFRRWALDTVQQDSGLAFRGPQTVSEWLEGGAYTAAVGGPAQAIVLTASSAEVGGVLLASAFYSADHALEHSVTVRNHLACGRWASPAWGVVTFYYWLYHVVAALTHLLGHTVTNVSGLGARIPADLAGVPARRTAGPQILRCMPAQSAVHRDVELTWSRKRSHDALWNSWAANLARCAGPALPGAPSGDEARLFGCLRAAECVLGPRWPSDLRNSVNYGAKSGYGAVRGTARQSVFGMVAVNPPTTIARLIDRLEANVAALDRRGDAADQVPIRSRVLVDTTFALHSLLDALLAEVVSARRLDRRWLNARRDFAGRHARALGWPALWPCA